MHGRTETERERERETIKIRNAGLLFTFLINPPSSSVCLKGNDECGRSNSATTETVEAAIREKGLCYSPDENKPSKPLWNNKRGQ